MSNPSRQLGKENKDDKLALDLGGVVPMADSVGASGGNQVEALQNEQDEQMDWVDDSQSPMIFSEEVDLVVLLAKCKGGSSAINGGDPGISGPGAYNELGVKEVVPDSIGKGTNNMGELSTPRIILEEE